MQKLDKLYYLNLNTDESMLKMIVYFDMLDISFIKILFNVILPNNITFSDPNTNKVIVEAIKNAPTFKFWGKEPILDNVSYFSNNNTTISYKIEEEKIKMLKIEKDGTVFERNYVNG